MEKQSGFRLVRTQQGVQWINGILWHALRAVKHFAKLAFRYILFPNRIYARR